MLSARPWQGSRGDKEHGERRGHMGREGMQALERSAPWDMSESRCGFSLECFLQVMEGSAAPEDRSGKSNNLREELTCK